MSKNPILKNKNKPKKMNGQANQPKQITRTDFDKMLNDMTPDQALMNLEALVKQALRTGLFKETAEILAADRAIVIFANTIQSHVQMEKKVEALESQFKGEKAASPMTGLEPGPHPGMKVVENEKVPDKALPQGSESEDNGHN